MSGAISFAGRNRVTLIVGGISIVLLGALLNLLLHTAHQPPVKQVPTFTIVPVTPPKPPPPPPPTPPQPKMITPEKTPMPDVKPLPQNQPPKAAAPKPAGPAPARGPSIHSAGPADAFNLSGSGFGGLAGGTGDGNGGGSWGAAADAAIAEALQSNPITRNASAGLMVKVYLNANGVITRVELEKSSGDPRVDAAIENQVLPGLQLPPGAPGAMVEVRLTGQAPT
jgi:outer membrane biosynthesis protein TonB